MKFMKVFRDKRVIISERNCNTVYLSDKYKDSYALIKIRVNDSIYIVLCIMYIMRVLSHYY